MDYTQISNQSEMTNERINNAAERIINQLKNGSPNDQTIGRIIESIDRCSKEIRNNEEDEVYLVLGLKGSGKTTVAAYLSGMDLEIKCQKEEQKQGDENKQNDLNDESKDNNQDKEQEDDEYDLIYNYHLQLKEKKEKIDEFQQQNEMIPKKFVSGSGQIFWDCPWIQDCKNVEDNILNSHYINKITKSSQKIKFILVIDGSSLDNQGFADSKGQSFKALISILFSMIQATDIDYSKHLTIIITKTSRQAEIKKVQQLIQEYTDKIIQNNKWFNKSDFKLFQEKLNLARVCLFPQCEGYEEEDALNNTFRNDLIQEINRTEFYTGRNIRALLFQKSLECLIYLYKYAREQLKSQFKQLCETISNNITQLNIDDFSKANDLIIKFDEIYKENSLKSNKEFFEFVKNNFTLPFKQILIESNEKYEGIQEMNKDVIEEIEFFLVEIYDELLGEIRLSSQEYQFFGKVSYYELLEGVSLIYKVVENQYAVFNCKEIKMIPTNIVEKQEENFLEQDEIQELEYYSPKQGILTQLIRQNEHDLFSKVARILKQMDEQDNQSYMYQVKEDILDGWYLGDTVGILAGLAYGCGSGVLSGAAFGAPLGPVGMIFGGAVGGIAGTSLGGLIGKGIGNVVGIGAGIVFTGARYTTLKVKQELCNIF